MIIHAINHQSRSIILTSQRSNRLIIKPVFEKKMSKSGACSWYTFVQNFACTKQAHASKHSITPIRVHFKAGTQPFDWKFFFEKLCTQQSNVFFNKYSTVEWKNTKKGGTTHLWAALSKIQILSKDNFVKSDSI